jgi:hypothetical protein
LLGDDEARSPPAPISSIAADCGEWYAELKELNHIVRAFEVLIRGLSTR